jgi:hypothetical protein
MRRALSLLFGFGLLLAYQNARAGQNQVDSGGSACRVIGSGATPPATCNNCEQWFDTDLDTTGNFVVCIGSNTWRAVDTKGAAGGGGDASSNTASSVDGEVALFSGTAGKTIRRSALTGVLRSDAGVLGTETASGSGNLCRVGSPAFTTNFRMAVAANPSVSVAGDTAFDLDALGANQGLPAVFDGTRTLWAVLIDPNTAPTDGDVPTYIGASKTWRSKAPAVGGGTGNVTGVGSSTAGQLAKFSDATGKAVAPITDTGPIELASGVPQPTTTSGNGAYVKSIAPALLSPTILGQLGGHGFENASHDHSGLNDGGQLNVTTAFNASCCLATAVGGTGTATITGSGAAVHAVSPAFTGTPTAPTPATSDNTTKLATTAFVKLNNALVNASAGPIVVPVDPAVGGTTSAGIQEAVTSCGAGQCIVQLPCGTTALPLRATWPGIAMVSVGTADNIVIQGCGQGTTKLTYTGTSGDGGTFPFAYIFRVPSGAESITFRDFEVDVTDTCTSSCTKSASVIIADGTPETVNVDHVTIKAAEAATSDSSTAGWHGFWAVTAGGHTKPKGVWITNNYFEVSTRGIEFQQCENCWAIHNEFTFEGVPDDVTSAPRMGVIKYDGTGVHIQDNIFDYGAVDGFVNPVALNGVVLSSDFGDTSIPAINTSVDVVGNTFKNMRLGGTAVNLAGYDFATVTGNFIETGQCSANSKFSCTVDEDCLASIGSGTCLPGDGIGISFDADTAANNQHSSRNTITSNTFQGFKDTNGANCPVLFSTKTADPDEMAYNLIANNTIGLNDTAADGFCGDESVMLRNFIFANTVPGNTSFCAIGQSDGRCAVRYDNASQTTTLFEPILGSYTVATLPSAAGADHRFAVVTDATVAGNCTAGGGSAHSLCEDMGAVWAGIGDGGTGGGGALNAITNPTGDSSFSFDVGETINWLFTGNFATDQFKIVQQTGNPTAGSLVVIQAADAQVSPTVRVENTAAVTIANAFVIAATNAGGVITVAMDLSDPEIVTALALGANDVTVNGVTISAAEFAALDNGINVSELVGGGTGVPAALAVNASAAGGFPVIVAKGTIILNTTAVTNATCGTAQTATATGLATTDVVNWSFSSDVSGVAGYNPAASPGLQLMVYPTAGVLNVKVCNPTGSPITPGASVTLNWQALR